MEIETFMRACREGGARIEAALRALDRELAPLLARECRSVVRDRDRADDLVQETFIKVWQRCTSFRGESQLLPWIRGILRHAILDFFRVARPEVPIDDEEGSMSAAAEQRVAELSEELRESPDDLFERAELEACYRRCNARFEHDHPMHAAVMRWIAEDGLTNRDVEELLQRSPGATREFISQCRRKARVYFVEWYRMATGLAIDPPTPSAAQIERDSKGALLGSDLRGLDGTA